ncbi:MAG: tRNA lysidine(34) synthetase TilS, partial [Deltaproteobacteria bacterium]
MTGPWTISTDDLAVLFRPLRPYTCVVLAVSGGSDSMALMHLCADWARAIGADAPRLIVATVDHGLREGSRDDAEFVAAAARGLGLDAHILSWQGEKPVQRVQERAREMRYLLLSQLAAARPAPCAIVTAHTQDDQGETFLMRLARGSGPDGLQSMRPMRRLSDLATIFLVRPLLGLGRENLRSYLAARRIAWLEDPSNENPKFERVRIRQAAGTATRLGLTPPKLALAAMRQRRAVEALEAATDALQRDALDLNRGAFASVHAGLFASAPEELRVRLMARLLAMFGGTAPPAELAQVERLVAAVDREAGTRATLGGCEVRSCRNTIRVFRERGRSEFGTVELRPGQEAVWDDRFLVRVGQVPATVTVRAFDKSARDSLRHIRTARL